MGHWQMYPLSPTPLPLRAAVVSCNGCRSSVLSLVILKAMAWPWWLMGRWSLKPKNWTHGGAAPLGQPSEHPVATDAGVVADRQLCAIDKVESGGLATAAMEQEVKGQQQRP